MTKWAVLSVLFGALTFGGGCSSTASGGGGNSGGTSNTGGTGGGASCRAAADACTDDATVCCEGTFCVANIATTGQAHCADSCVDGSECNSGCCAPLQSGGAVCAPQEVCNASATCRPAGDECTDDVNSCCIGSRCVADIVTPGQSHCSAECTAGSGCNSGCCAALESFGAVCAPAEVCEGGGGPSCAPTDASCANGETCCSDSICVQRTTGTLCAAICTDHSECSSNCCALLDDSTETVCSPESFCMMTPEPP